MAGPFVAPLHNDSFWKHWRLSHHKMRFRSQVRVCRKTMLLFTFRSVYICLKQKR
jgi:hypothetical protein